MFDMCKAGGVVMPLPLDNKSKVALVFLCFNCGLRLIWPKGKCSQNTTAMTGAKNKGKQTYGWWWCCEEEEHFYLQVGDGRSEIICYLHICQK